ncbi:ribonuclease 2-like [Chlorella sorokiniana]|uniref:Ribonuclease 2-like n=1 Tax=Chlorella sorokiniana TaxID=3076 RepID=A0A2P6TIZ7_CHLSO|nr:ribonuclease 2-like [Chlorella sorokiniana]|eukprot:PRW39224.1 ribonuclease 2-like [Chlorella sorokiniana]
MPAQRAMLLLLLAAAAAALEHGGGVQLPAASLGKRGRRGKDKGPDGDPGFDLFLFVRSYSPTFCRQERCTIRPITAFTIHGLWPEYANGGWPEFCGDHSSSSNAGSSSSGGSSLAASGSTLGSSGASAMQQQEQQSDGAAWTPTTAAGEQEQQQEDEPDTSGKGERRRKNEEGDEPSPELQPPAPSPAPAPQPEEGNEQQRCEWPSFKGPDGDFWDHEYEKHGTCARPVTGDRPAFFNATMRLHEQLDLDVALATAGILPSDSDQYVTRKVARAVEDAFGVAPLLECWHGQLLEVRLCVGLDLKLRTCPPGVVRSHRATCGKTVSLPVGSPVPAECRPYFPPWKAPNSGGQDLILVRIATGVAVMGAAAAAVLLLL